MKTVIGILLGAILGVLVFYLGSAFVSMDWSTNPNSWDPMARFMMLYSILIGGVIGGVFGAHVE